MKVSNYGELISKVTGHPLLAYEEFGSYQGDYIAVIDAPDGVQLWKGTYGSCSGCDWLEASQNWSTSEVPDEDAKSYVGADLAFLTIPKETARALTEEALREILPANTRVDFEADYSDIKVADLIRLLHAV